MAEKTKKLVLIGAGSAMFTQGLVADLIHAISSDVVMKRYEWELALVDIDAEALDMVCSLTKRMLDNASSELPILISCSTDRRDVLNGANVVVSTIAVGKRRAWETDVFIPRKYGIYQPVGDTVMPGGISRALRMIPATVDIAMDIKRMCPEAVFINYANPMTATCWAVRKETGVEVVGLCHGVNHIEGFLASHAGVDRSRVSSVSVGVNHLTFMTKFLVDGEDAWPLVSERADRRSEPFSWSLFDRYGAYPCVNDRHVTEFFPERFPSGAYYGKVLGVDAFSFEDTIRLGDAIFEKMGKQARGEITFSDDMIQRNEGEHEQLLDILESLWSGRPSVFSMNLPNTGQVPNLPLGAVIESPVATCGGKFCPLSITDFPDKLAAIISRRLSSVQLTVEAALSGDIGLVVEALLMDGAIHDWRTAEALANELIHAHKQYLPRFE